MPLRMHKITRGKDKGKYVAVEPDGTRVGKPTTKTKARARVQAQNIPRRHRRRRT